MNLFSLLPIAAILDANAGIFSDAQAQTSIATHASTNIIDWGLSDPDTGGGHPVWIMVRVNTAFTAASTATLDVKIQHSQDNSTWVNLIGSKQYTTSDVEAIAAGEVHINQVIPPAHMRYMRVAYIIGTAVLADGKWDAFLHLGGANADGNR